MKSIASSLIKKANPKETPDKIRHNVESTFTNRFKNKNPKRIKNVIGTALKED